MDDYLEVDLKGIINNILAKWYWIILTAFIVGLVVFLFSYLQPDVYRSTARFVLTQPPYIASFENKYTTSIFENPSPEALLNIVNSDTVIAALLDLWESPEKEQVTLRQFKQEHLEAVIGEDGMLVSLNVKVEDRENSAEIANEWVNLAMKAVDSKFFGYETDQVTFFESQTALALIDLEEAGQALVDFEEQNTTSILINNQNNLLARQMEMNQTIRTIESVQEDIQALLDQLDDEAQEHVVDSSTKLSFLLIQARLFNSPVMIGNSPYVSIAESSSPQLVIDLGGLEGIQTVGEFQVMLDDWLVILDDRIVTLQESQMMLEDDILTLQAEIQTLENESEALQDEYSRQQSVYDILSTKLEEVTLAMPNGESGYVSLVSPATIPDQADAIPHNTVRNTAISMIASGFLAVVGVVIADWWKNTNGSDKKVEE